MHTTTPVLMTLQQLGLSCERALLCQQLDLTIHAGDCIAVLGPNGSGKTTLLHTLSGLRKTQQGSIWLQQKKLCQWSRLELAKKIGMLFQNTQDDMPATVMEAVLLGRLPHQRGWQGTREADWRASLDAVREMGLDALTDHEVGTLSGGERQRVAIACLLAQSPDIYFLDEPTNHLDISFQIKTMQLFSKLAKDHQRAVVMATHDINLAARFCNKILLMCGNGRVIGGNVDEVMTPSQLSEAFAFDIHCMDNSEQRWFYPGGFTQG